MRQSTFNITPHIGSRLNHTVGGVESFIPCLAVFEVITVFSDTKINIGGALPLGQRKLLLRFLDDIAIGLLIGLIGLERIT
ncbi:hypothetical protein D3C76_1592230 [compost metagenome]